MRKAEQDPGKAPAVLDKIYRKNSTYPEDMTELERARFFRAQPGNAGKSFKFSRYSEDEVKAALEDIFHGKCAYCESPYSTTQPVDVEHYRPKAGVNENEDHPGYWWVAMAWDNLLPSCIDCNRRRGQTLPDGMEQSALDLLFDAADFKSDGSINMGKATAFPLLDEATRIADEDGDLDSEARLLLHPCKDDPRAHLAFNTGREDRYSLAMPREDDQGVPSPMGRFSIQVYGLNRLGLVQARTRLLRDLDFLLELYIGLGEMQARLQGREGSLDDIRALDALDDDQKDFLKSVIKNDRSVRSQLTTLRDNIIDKIIEKTNADQPYSELAWAWLHDNLEDVGGV